MKLYSFWRSLASFRVRIALKLKRKDFDVVSTDLLAGDQFKSDFNLINPQAMVPSLVLDDGSILYQSMALLEYLDEVYPDPPLMPQNAMARARVRALCMMAVADIHPLVVPRVRKYMTDRVGLDEAALNQWIENWTNLGLTAMEAHIDQNNPEGIYCEGDSVSLADLCLIPQVGAAKMFGFDVSHYPHLSRIFETCMNQPEFFDSRPQVQPDYPEE